jgi:group I intron endonuclease
LNFNYLRNVPIILNENAPNLKILLVVVLIYDNVKTEKSRISRDLKGFAGIYGFLCKSTQKLYIGSSIDLGKRFNQHIKGSQSNIKLQNAIKKYKLQDFIFIVFEYCDPKDLISREQNIIDSLKPEYNISPTAGSSLGIKRSSETKALMSESQKSVDRTGENNPMFGKTFTHSEDTKALISAANKDISRNLGENNPMFGKTHSAETLAKMSSALSGEKNPMSKKVFVYSLDSTNNTTVFLKEFNTCKEAAKYFNCSSRTISNYLDKEKLYKKEWMLYSTEQIYEA